MVTLYKKRRDAIAAANVRTLAAMQQHREHKVAGTLVNAGGYLVKNVVTGELFDANGQLVLTGV